MYEIKVKRQFCAAHNLRNYKGKCERLHGHNWQVEAAFCSQRPDKTGMVLDFTSVKSLLDKILKKIDHSYLNKLAYFKKDNPTSENLARFIYMSLKKNIRNKNAALKSVTVWESKDCSAVFYE